MPLSNDATEAVINGARYSGDFPGRVISRKNVLRARNAGNILISPLTTLAAPVAPYLGSRVGHRGFLKTNESEQSLNERHADYVAEAIVDQMMSGKDRLPAELSDKETGAKQELINAIRDQVILPQAKDGGFFSSDRLGMLF